MLIGVLVSLLFAYLAVRDVDFDALREGLARSDYWSLLPAGVLLALAVFLRASGGGSFSSRRIARRPVW